MILNKNKKRILNKTKKGKNKRKEKKKVIKMKNKNPKDNMSKGLKVLLLVI
jgi:hypothetical protein